MLSARRTIAHFEVLEKLGSGGMGEVYRARDIQLDRVIALKVLPPARAADAAMRSRLLREARAASALNHPNIVTIYEAGSADGIDFIAMEFVEGTTLAESIPAHGMPVAQALSIAQGISSALAAAHRAGIIHRDLKPGNVMVRPDGSVKVMDFGLAKALLPAADEGEATRTELDTAPGTVLGTGPYMSPEQAEGKPLDVRSDIFSFGSMFYETLTGQRAFQGDTLISTISAILKDTPPSLHQVRREVDPALEQIVDRCLKKNREARYPSGAELHIALASVHARPVQSRARRTVVAAAAIVCIALVAVCAWWIVKQRRVRWVYNEAIPQMYRLAADEKHIAAWELARRAQQIAPNDSVLEQALARFEPPPVTLQSQPAGARVYFRPYLEPASAERLLGQTPLTVRLPVGMLRLRFVKDGYEEAEGSVDPLTEPPVLTLDAKGTTPGGMVSVPAGTRTVDGKRVDVPAFWLDKFEVTNRQYKLFLDQGGYRKREYWKHPFVKDGREIAWDQAMQLLVDATGKPGPATWELGSYPENQGDYPVGGVSWYEAAAYADFAGKSLPTVAHWQRAVVFGYFSDILKLSNFSNQGPAPVGKYQGLGPFGTYDMAGNLKEWCFNAIGSRRVALGGAWNEPSYSYREFDARDPIVRLPTYGFRCAKFRDPPPQLAFEAMQQRDRDPTKETPVSDEIFRAWRNSYAYDPTPLDAKVEAVDDTSEYYRKEKITYAAPYGGERIFAWLFLPKTSSPPYQTVVYYPAGEATSTHDSSGRGPEKRTLFVMRSGRALLYPVYQGTYERIRPAQAGPNAYRELVIQRSKDLRRSVDYLQTRKDIDRTNLAYYGTSMGCREGIVMLALEPRFRTALLAYCGIPTVRQPDGTDPLDFAPRVKIPSLLIEGRDDFTYPYLTSQLPLFHLLGTPEQDKKMVSREGGHIDVLPPEIIREVLNWLDRYLGPVR